MSKTTRLILAMSLSESGFRITTERLVPMLVATTRLMGTAIPRAHGQAITMTATAASKPRTESPITNHQTKKVATANTITLGTKTLEMESVREASLLFWLVASRTRSAMRLRRLVVEEPTASSFSSPESEVAPAERLAPLLNSWGSDSPVRVELSTEANSESKTPSTGIRSPAATKTMAPWRRV